MTFGSWWRGATMVGGGGGAGGEVVATTMVGESVGDGGKVGMQE